MYGKVRARSAPSSFVWPPTSAPAHSTARRVGQAGGGPPPSRVSRWRRGSGGAEKRPQNCAALIKKQTNRAGRSGRGRMFLPAVLDEAQVSQTGIISPLQLADLQPRSDTFLEIGTAHV